MHSEIHLEQTSPPQHRIELFRVLTEGVVKDVDTVSVNAGELLRTLAEYRVAYYQPETSPDERIAASSKASQIWDELNSSVDNPILARGMTRILMIEQAFLL